ncbi:MAG: GGDEF domain-containing protein [Acidobacteriota bacterium]
MPRRDETTRAYRPRQFSRDERPFLVVLEGEHAGRLFSLDDRESLSIGRSRSCEVCLLRDDVVSRRHAQIARDENGDYVLSDLESTNGTRLNGREVSSHALNRGDRIELGEASLFRFDYLGTQERELLESGHVDGLTGLRNRKALDAAFPRLLDECQAGGGRLALLILDLDHFKRINDEHGHARGDQALVQAANCFKSELRAEDRAELHRHGGEEFAILLPMSDERAALPLAERLRRRLSADPSGVPLTVSIGVTLSQPGDTPESLYERA